MRVQAATAAPQRNPLVSRHGGGAAGRTGSLERGPSSAERRSLRRATGGAGAADEWRCGGRARPPPRRVRSLALAASRLKASNNRPISSLRWCDRRNSMFAASRVRQRRTQPPHGLARASERSTKLTRPTVDQQSPPGPRISIRSVREVGSVAVSSVLFRLTSTRPKVWPAYRDRAARSEIRPVCAPERGDGQRARRALTTRLTRRRTIGACARRCVSSRRAAHHAVGVHHLDDRGRWGRRRPRRRRPGSGSQSRSAGGRVALSAARNAALVATKELTVAPEVRAMRSMAASCRFRTTPMPTASTSPMAESPPRAPACRGQRQDDLAPTAALGGQRGPARRPRASALPTSCAPSAKRRSGRLAHQLGDDELQPAGRVGGEPASGARVRPG